MTGSFQSLDYWITPPPLPAILATLVVLGFKYLGDRLCRLLFRRSQDAVNNATSFVLAIAIVTGALQIMVVTWKVPVQFLRLAAWALAALGCIECVIICGVRNPHPWRRFASFVSQQPILERATALLLLATFIFLALMALSPPTDADSLDYHLGVPLDFLRRGAAHARYDWFHARLIGSGELLNMLGLAGGTDILGATLSAASLTVLLSAVVSRAATSRDKILIVASLVTCPLMLFLVPNQKPFLLPAVASTLALLLVVERFRMLDPQALFGALGCIFFAMSCKYSFLLSGSVVLLVVTVGAYRSRRLAWAIGLAFLCYLFLVFPMQWQKMLFYGDPISPMLERFKGHGDLALVRFAQFLRGYTMSSFPFPMCITAPYSLGSISSVLGVGVLLCAVVIRNVSSSAILVIAASGAVLINYLAGARSAGYFLEPCLWLAIAGAAAPWGLLKRVFYKLLMVQAAVMVLLTGFGAISLFPGALTSGLRSHVMAKNSHQYTVMCWLDEVLPRDAVVVSTLRSHALMPRPFVVKDIITWTNWASCGEAEKASSIVRGHEPNVLASEPLIAKGLSNWIGAQNTNLLAGPRQFRTATRNPWNREQSATLAVYGVFFAEEAGEPNRDRSAGR